MTNAGRGPGGAGKGPGRVALPGTDGLVLERRPDGTFHWTLAVGRSIEGAEVLERARHRLHECEEALELCDYWLGEGPYARTTEARDEILDSRSRYGAEGKLLQEFLSWVER